MEIPEQIRSILQQAEPIGLHQMDGVSLQHRMDRKYMLHWQQLPRILAEVLKDYFVLEIDGRRVFSYQTSYFDTPDYQFFRDHHNGLTDRIKVRCRRYVETNNTFFEIKRKYQGTKTDKYRKSIDDFLPILGNEEVSMITDRYKKHDVSNLSVTLNNRFSRITLVGKGLTERITIDMNIEFSAKGKSASLDDIVIIEVKQGKYDDQSVIVQLLKKERIYPGSISKYAYGLLMLDDNVKYNAFKPLMNRVSKIQNLYGFVRNYA